MKQQKIINIFMHSQARAQALTKQLYDTYEQIEQNSIALSTFKFLAEQEEAAIPRRLEVNQNLYTKLLLFWHALILNILF